MNTYDLGDRIRLNGLFTMDETPTDPDAVTVRIKPKLADALEFIYLTDAEVVKDSTGRYHVFYDPEEPGEHAYRFEGTGVAKGAGESRFFVRKSAFDD